MAKNWKQTLTPYRLDESMTKGGRDVKETLLMMDRVDAELADRRKKLKKSGSITEGSQ